MAGSLLASSHLNLATTTDLMARSWLKPLARSAVSASSTPSPVACCSRLACSSCCVLCEVGGGGGVMVVYESDPVRPELTHTYIHIHTPPINRTTHTRVYKHM